MGLRKHEGQGCILADEMFVTFSFSLAARLYKFLRGLGKTLQVRSRMYLYADLTGCRLDHLSRVDSSQ